MRKKNLIIILFRNCLAHCSVQFCKAPNFMANCSLDAKWIALTCWCYLLPWTFLRSLFGNNLTCKCKHGLWFRRKMNCSHLLMLFPSLNLSATAPVFATRSDPARSTREIRLTFSPLTPLWRSVRVWVNTTEKTAWDLKFKSIFV